MEKTLKFNSQIATSLVQSERLSALGLKKETADMCYTLLGGHDESLRMLVAKPCFYHNDIPAWSLHRLLIMLDADVQTNGHYLAMPHYGYAHANIYDNLCLAIEEAIKEGYFNKEYLV